MPNLTLVGSTRRRRPTPPPIPQEMLAAYIRAVRTVENALDTYRVIKDALLLRIRSGAKVEAGPYRIERDGRKRITVRRA